MNNRENQLRAWRFEGPERVPVSYGLWGSAMIEENYDQKRLWELIDAYPVIAEGKWRPDSYPVRFHPISTVGERYVDPWGCVWMTAEEGATGQVVESPLTDWAAFDDFTPPTADDNDGRREVDWQDMKAKAEQQRARGELVRGALPHGHTFLRLCDLRGYENLLCDMMMEEPKLDELVEMNRAFNLSVVEKMLGMRPDVMAYPEDLGMQIGPMLSPDQFRKYIVPSYKSLMTPARDAGVLAHMHSDGDIRTLFDDLVECGVQVINCQEDAVTLEWLKAEVKGRVAIDLSLSARLFAKGEPQEIRDYIRRCVEELSMPEGGLSFGGQLAPGVPWENIEAIFETLQEVHDTPIND
ncbi:MAG: uroporphyrinogen decarboxylase family protein [Candidatus Sumerlaeia bacterium]